MTAGLIFTGLFAVMALTGALFVMFTARDDGGVGWPRWPARYPPGPRGNYGDVRGRVAAAVMTAALMSRPVTEKEWDAARGAGWRHGDEEEEART